jgi:sulfatase maturation enzyme AslB (radical SAM superfamily)
MTDFIERLGRWRRAISARFDTRIDEAESQLRWKSSNLALPEAVPGPADSMIPAELIPPEVNEALASEEFATGATTIRNTPVSIALETTSRCNLRCVMCPHAIGAVHRPAHFDDTLVSKMSRALKQARILYLHGIGEPTNSPAFWKALRELPPPDICSSSVNSNFTVINEERIRDLIESNLGVVNVSLDAGTAATYTKIRGFSFDVVLGNIERLLTARRAHGQGFPLVCLNMTLMRSNIEELGDFIRVAKRLGVDYVFLGHLNRYPEADMAPYRTVKDGWIFDYACEGLWNYPALSNRCIREAVVLAREAGVPLHLDQVKEVYFDDDIAIT